VREQRAAAAHTALREKISAAPSNTDNFTRAAEMPVK
jgi:hypothetical protein